MMQRFAGGDSNAIYNIVTGDESWICSYDPETKRQFAQWVFPFEELPTKPKLKSGKKDGGLYTPAVVHVASCIQESAEALSRLYFAHGS
ncbi:hypothetical protein EVAR_10913_1 [Eumeta japonica]|uniref:Mariner Mos1 transposase n=1 Tax=Eumeta variegata TaxID=151549 RepID=A0A4C1U7D2_EUMVA|nr:hypothetical protein EVAR_10913_1 [Eumeta japonica]